MSKFYGTIGFLKTEETSPGVWTPNIVERQYYGDIVNNRRRWNNTNNINDDFTINMSVSILADSYVMENSHCIAYVEVNNSKWKISDIDIQYPRLTLNLGGLYNE